MTHQLIQITPRQLRTRRELARLTQAKLADLLGVDTRTICRWECNDSPVPVWMDCILRELERQNENQTN